jgi:hypothetical protein
MTNKNTRSLGSLRAVSDRPNEMHPNFLGNLKLQLHTLLYLYKQASETDGDEFSAILQVGSITTPTVPTSP